MAPDAAQRYNTPDGLQDDLHELTNLFHGGVLLRLEVLSSQLAHEDVPAAMRLLPGIISSARSVQRELGTLLTLASVTEEAFDEALTLIVQRWNARLAGQAPRLRLQCPPDLFVPSPVRETLLRVASSAIANAVLHSGAFDNASIDIAVSVDVRGGDIRFEVRDTGRGCVELVPGFGIQRMREHVARLNSADRRATLTIDSVPDRGTSVLVDITGV